MFSIGLLLVLTADFFSSIEDRFAILCQLFNISIDINIYIASDGFMHFFISSSLIMLFHETLSITVIAAQ